MLRGVVTSESVRVAFDHYLNGATKGQGVPDDSHLDTKTVDALNEIARSVAEGGHATVMQLAAARGAFKRQLANLEIGRPEIGRT